MNDDGGHVATAPGTAKTKKKKIGKKERMKLKAKQLMEEGMSEADARKQAGLNPLPPAAAATKEDHDAESQQQQQQQRKRTIAGFVDGSNIKNAKSLRELFDS